MSDDKIVKSESLESRQTLTPTIGLEEAGKLLRCHPDTVRKMAKAGDLPGTKVGRSWVFYTERLLEWLDARIKAGNSSLGRDSLSGGSALAAKLARAREQRIKDKRASSSKSSRTGSGSESNSQIDDRD